MRFGFQLTSLLICLLIFGNRSFGQDDCRLKPSEFRPIIQAFNPFFTNHQWKATDKVELARLDDHRAIAIAQSGCIRHHIQVNLMLDPAVVSFDAKFWEEEAAMIMYAIFYKDPKYQAYQQEFEEKFAQKMYDGSRNQEFNFPIGTRNFVCKVIPTGAHPTLQLEMVEYVFKEEILRKKAVYLPDSRDDGWK